MIKKGTSLYSSGIFAILMFTQSSMAAMYNIFTQPAVFSLTEFSSTPFFLETTGKSYDELNIDYRDKREQTCLHWAARKGHQNIAYLLLKTGFAEADKDAQDDSGATPLHHAARYGHEEIATMLLQAGADKDAQDDRFLTPLDIAIKGKKENTCYLLIMMNEDNIHKDKKLMEQLHFLGKGLLQQNLSIMKEHTEQHYQQCRALLEDFCLPTVIALIIFEYHKSADTYARLFIRAKPFIKKNVK